MSADPQDTPLQGTRAGWRHGPTSSAASSEGMAELWMRCRWGERHVHEVVAAEGKGLQIANEIQADRPCFAGFLYGC